LDNARCEHEGCGGCLYRDVPYEGQLAIKDGELRRLMDGSGIDCGEYLGIAASPALYAYRNKMDYSFGDERKGGEITLGMHRRGRFMSVMTTDGCLLVDGDFNAILAAALRFAREKGYAAYNRKSRCGLLRNLVIRRGARTRRILVNLVCSSQGCVDGDAFVERLLSLGLGGGIDGILLTVNDRPADFVYCDELRTLYGNSFYFEEMLGLRFKVGAFSFFQTNVEAVERLCETVFSWMPPLDGKTVFDLYCGAGVITQALAKRAGRAVGIEISGEAVGAARENAAANGLANCSFIEGDVLERIDALAGERPDFVVLDPPRAGVHPKALEKIAGLRADALLYISCNPKSMMENLRAMNGLYGVKCVQAFDNFPFTGHTEAAALLELRRQN
jgi:23S rRNA (uracil-5-)-methyltransferase RumA